MLDPLKATTTTTMTGVVATKKHSMNSEVI
jgi:hypothetical protein